VETLYLNELHWRGRVDEHVFVVWAALAAEGAFPRLRRIDVTEGCLTNAPVLRTAFHDLCRCVCVTSLILRINIASAEHFLGERDRAGLGYLQELHLICELSGSTSYLFQLNEKVLLDDVAGWLVQASAIHTLMLRGSVRCADLARLPCASTLRTLYISCCPGPGFTEDIATRVAFPRLQDLDIVAYDANFQLTHILLESCTSLETISIRHYSAHGKLLPTVANTDVHALFAHIGAQPALRTLTLRMRMAVEPAAFWELMPSLPRLTRLCVPLAQLSTDTATDMHVRCPNVQQFQFALGPKTISLAQAMASCTLTSA
jgi:hypothetical protein